MTKIVKFKNKIKKFFKKYKVEDKINRFFKKYRPKNIILSFLTICIAFAGIIILWAATLTLPDFKTFTEQRLQSSTKIYDNTGKILLYNVNQDIKRTVIPYEEMGTNIKNATIAIEDSEFYNHKGIRITSILRATVWAKLTGKKVSGGSTITQQLIKNTLLTPDKTFKRKIKEVILAFWAERLYTKDEILQMYLNEAPYGGPAWGVEAAAQTYFGKSAKDLSLSEAAFLAGLPAAPTEYSPFGIHPEKGKERQVEVLRRMVEEKYITQNQAESASTEKLEFKSQAVDIKAPHFVMYVRSLLAGKYGERVVSQGGLKVITTLDLDLQNMADEAVNKNIAQLNYLKVGNGAAMITDSKNGQILAMVGSKDYFEAGSGNYNVALAIRQPGSSIKPVTYATGFMQGYSPATILLDGPTTFPQVGGKPYSPVNYDNRFHGPTTIRTALGSSYNVPAVKMLALVGLPQMMQVAKDMGITTFGTPENYGLSLTLGGGGVRLIDMMTVYGTFATNGTRHTSEAVLIVYDSNGNVLEDHRQNEGKQVLSENVAYLISNILSDSVARMPAFGPHSLLEIPGHTVAVKTGTSDDKKDNWTFGYTPEYVVGTWVGNNDNSPMDPMLSSGITGAAPIWHDIMTQLLTDKPDLAFSRPPGIVETVVDGRRDLTIAGVLPKSVIALKKSTKKDEATGADKETTIYSDQFSTFNPDQNKLIP